LLNEPYPCEQNFSQVQDLTAPPWSDRYKTRPLLSHVVFNKEAELKLKTGVYLLSIKYCKGSEKKYATSEAGIIIGEMDFNNSGYAMAEGVDWDRLLNNQRQTQLPYANGARGMPQWLRRKICEPWEDGDILKFRIDTNENTIVFQRGNTPKRVFWNVLAFTNNRTFPEFLHVYAYCGGVPVYSSSGGVPGPQSNLSEDMRLTILP